MNARTNPFALIGERLERSRELSFAELFGDGIGAATTSTTTSVKPGDALHPAQILENMRALMKAMPPAPFNGADRLAVDRGTMTELRGTGKVDEKMSGSYLTGMPISVDGTYPPNTMMGFRRRGTGIPDELVWSNRFDVKAAQDPFPGLPPMVPYAA